MSDQTKGLAALLAAHGRNGDTELIHATKGEVAALNQLKHGISGSGLPRNPHTGLREANFFDQYGVPALPAIAGLAAGAMTGGTMAAPAAALAGAATGAGTKAIQGGSTQDVLLGGGLGAVSGYGAGTLGAGLAEAGTGAAAAAPTTTAVAAPVDAGVGGANAFTGNPAFGGSGQAFGTFGGATPNASNAFVTGMQDGAQAFNAGTPATAAAPTAAAPTTANAIQDVATVDANTGITTLPNGTTTPNAPVNTPPEVPKYGSKMEFLQSKDASGAVSPIAIGTLGLASLNQGNLSGVDTGTGVDKALPKSEVYYTPTGERRTRVVDRPQYGNVNMARGGDVYGDYDGADEAPDGGYHPGGGLNYANGGLASYGWGGFVESIQPGGAWGNATADLYGVVDKNAPWLKDITPGGAVGQLQPGRRDWERKQAEEEQRKKDEEAAGIAAAAKAKQTADFNQQWSERYGAPVTMAAAGGGISSLGHYSDGGQLLRGPGDGVSDSIPASIEGKRPARLADGEFVIPARAVSELGNGSTEAGSKQLYAMLERIAKKRKAGKGLAYESNPKKIMPV